MFVGRGFGRDMNDRAQRVTFALPFSQHVVAMKSL
jgi:hypothetical protein